MTRLWVAICVTIWCHFIIACCCMSDTSSPTPKEPDAKEKPLPEPEKPAPAPIDKSQPIKFDPGEIYVAYIQNKKAANEHYKGATMDAAGVVSNTGHNADGPFVILLVGRAKLIVSLWFDKKLAAEVKTLEKGQRIVARGKVDYGQVDQKDGTVYFQLVDCVFLEKAAPDNSSQKSDPKVDPKPKGPTDAEILATRQAVYVKIVTVTTEVEAAAAKKFKVGTIPYQSFLDREIPKALDKLAGDLGQTRGMIDDIKKEGDSKKWSKK